MSEKKELIFKDVREKMEDGEMFLVALGEELNLDTDKVLEASEFYNSKHDIIKQLSYMEKDWIKRAVIYYEMKNENEMIKKHINLLNALYLKVKDKPYFVVSLCTDGIIDFTYFDRDKCVSPCGNFLYGQCPDNCNDEVISLIPIYEQMYDVLANEEDVSEISMKIIELMPKCENCQKDIIVNTVKCRTYSESNYLHNWEVYTKWLETTLNKKLVMLELGVGFDTPTVVKWPFEKIAFFNQKSFLIRVNPKFYFLTEELKGKAYGVGMKSKSFLKKLVIE